MNGGAILSIFNMILKTLSLFWVIYFTVYEIEYPVISLDIKIWYAIFKIAYFKICNLEVLNLFMPTVAFNICCPRDCVSRDNGGTAGAPLKPLRDDSALRTISSLRGLRGAPEVPPLCRETQSLGQQMLERWENMVQRNIPCVNCTRFHYQTNKFFKFYKIIVNISKCCKYFGLIEKIWNTN